LGERMSALIKFVRAVDWLNELVGRLAAWLTLVTVVICATVVVLRYGFNEGFVWMQELYVWTGGAIFMLGAGYTLLHGGHVRVDIFYARASAKRRALIDLLGTLVFLLPWLILVFIVAWPYVRSAWLISEASAQGGGMPGLYIFKSVLLAFCVLLGLQGLAMIGRSILVLTGRDGASAPDRQEWERQG
jgi:TRAP-type mannitol/chloroaromatic compound transport system permease small subunit